MVELDKDKPRDLKTVLFGADLLSIVAPCGLHVIGYRVRNYNRSREDFRTFPGLDEWDEVTMISIEALLINGKPAAGTLIDFPGVGMFFKGITTDEIVSELEEHVKTS